MRNALYFLGQLTDEDVDWMISAGHREIYHEKDTLIGEGTEGASLYIILTGEFGVYVNTNPANKASLTKIAELKTGETVGEMSFLDTSPASATVIALRDCNVFSLTHATIEEKLESDPYFAKRFYRALAILLSSRLRQLDQAQGRKNAPESGKLEEDELPSSELDSVFEAGTRFWRLINRLMKVEA